jgi:hypothetical protein
VYSGSPLAGSNHAFSAFVNASSGLDMWHDGTLMARTTWNPSNF